MNIPNTMMRNANSRRGGMRSDAAAPAFIIEGDAVVASAMISSEQAPGFRPEREGITAVEPSPAHRGRPRCRHRAAPSRVSTVV